MRTETPPWAKRALVWVVVLLYLPALLTFFTHVTEHAWPLGFTRLLPGQVPPLPINAAWALVGFANHCVIPTWCGMGLAFFASMFLQLSVVARGALGALSALAYVSMTGMQAILHSCWGEAPHAFWFASRY
jgi:hypothetical protein